jgi:two-component system OmpR family response regulator
MSYSGGAQRPMCADRHPSTIICRRVAEKGDRMALLTYLVEDNPIVREHLAGALRDTAPVQIVGEADSESSAVYWLTRPNAQWDLAVVDLALREGTGLGVIERCARQFPERRMVVLSNHASPGLSAHCLAKGADAVFDKSLEIDRFADYCAQLSRHHRD